MSETSPPPKKRRSVFWYVLLIFCFILLAFSPFLLFMDTPLRISKETTYITEPLTPDGTRVDYLRAIELRKYPPQMQTDENGCRIVTHAIGPPKDISEPQLQEQYYEKLGLSPTHTPPLVFLSSPDFLKDYWSKNPDALELWKEKYIEFRKSKAPSYVGEPEEISEYELEEFINKELTFEDFPPWEVWLQQVNPVLDVLGEAVRKPVFVAPYVFHPQETSLITLMMPELTEHRELARALAKRVDFYVEKGNIDAAIDDIITCRRLGRHSQQRGFFVQYLVGIAIEGIAIAKGPNENLDFPMNAEQIKRLLREIDDLPEACPPGTIFNGERLFGLSLLHDIIYSENRRKELEFFLDEDFAILLHGGGGSSWWERFLNPNFYISALGYDWNIVAKRVNEAYDRAVEGEEVETHFSSNPLVWLGKRSRSEELAKKMIFSAFMFNAFSEADNRTQCVQKMQRITLAMLLYEQEHGTLPPTYTFANDGTTPLHSWRVLLLPYFENEKYKGLYEKIRLEEPWDSPWNKQFHETTIDIYACPSAAKNRQSTGTAPRNGRSDYTVIIGEETPFFADGSTQTTGRRSKDFGRHLILLAERTDPICWMDPMQEISQSDAETFIDQTSRVLGSRFHPGGANFTLKSAAGLFLSEVTDLEYLRMLIRGTAGERP